MLECVVNLSEGRDRALLDQIAAATGGALIDLHADPWHNRSVFTLAHDDVLAGAKALTVAALDRLDLATHEGAHPRHGLVDVVPFVPITPGQNTGTVDLAAALAARAAYATWAGDELGLPAFCYGPERSLPEVRRRAFVDLFPDVGPKLPHPKAGMVCVGARPLLVAYNLWLANDDIELARAVARTIRSEHVRALGLELGTRAQVSCNLVAPEIVGPAQVYDLVKTLAAIDHAELVGLMPRSILAAIPNSRFAELDLDDDRTIEARLEARRRGQRAQA